MLGLRTRTCDVPGNPVVSCVRGGRDAYQETVKDLTLGPELAMSSLIIGRLGDL